MSGKEHMMDLTEHVEEFPDLIIRPLAPVADQPHEHDMQDYCPLCGSSVSGAVWIGGEEYGRCWNPECSYSGTGNEFPRRWAVRHCHCGFA
jgi:formate dehydrogenase maturation protein FdhE